MEPYNIRKYILRLAVESLETSKKDGLKLADVVQKMCGGRSVLCKTVMDKCEELTLASFDNRKDGEIT
jgi:hypothetical protein